MKKMMFVILLAAGVVFICLFALELSVRLFFRAEVLGSKMPLIYQYHEKLGHTYKPGAVGFMSRHGEIFSKVVINASGFRDYDYPPQKPAGVFRIAFLGDSFVTGNHVPLEKIFPKILEKKLRKKLGPRIEALNFGVDGYGPREEYLLFELSVKRFQPDLVIQCLFPFNDVDDVMKGRVYRNEYRGAVLKYQTREEFDALKAERDRELAEEAGEQAEHPVLSFLNKKLWFLRFIRGRRLRSATEIPQEAEQLDEWQLPEIDRDPDHFSSAFKEALRETKSLVLSLQEQVKASGARFALVIIPADLEVSPDEWSSRPFTISSDLFEKAMHKGCRLFEEFAKNHGIPNLNLLPLFRMHYGESKLYWTYDAHWTDSGHELAADSIYAFLLDENLVPHPE